MVPEQGVHVKDVMRLRYVEGNRVKATMLVVPGVRPVLVYFVVWQMTPVPGAVRAGRHWKRLNK